jgi:DNA mismatch repair protein MutS2
MYQYDSIIEKVKKEGIKSLSKDYERLKQMKKEIEEMVSKVRKSSNLYDLKKTNKELEIFLKEVKKYQSNEEKKGVKKLEDSKLLIGDWVKISSSTGKIIDIKGNRAKIDLNGVVIESNLSKLRKADSPSAEDTYKPGISYINPSVSSRIDLRGFKVEDAIERIEEFIYELKSSDLSSGTILHGKGTGVLMQAVHEYLRGNSNIKNFRFGMPEEGGEGVTIIEI